MIEKKRIQQQKKDVEAMIRIYCSKKHNSKEELCSECRELMNYAAMRLENCKFGDNKPTCGKCKIHCYRKDMKEKMIEIMKYSGPRMLIHNPVIAFRHLIDGLKYK